MAWRYSPRDSAARCDLGASNRHAVARVITAQGNAKMTLPDQILCRWCGEPITAPRRGQRFCCSRHRYLWHQAQGFSPAQFQEKVTAIVRRELKRAGVALPGLA